MSPVTVFYANMVYQEADKWIPTRDLPDGAYVCVKRTPDAEWYIVQHAGPIPINLSDVPKALRALQLILQ